MKTLFVVEGKDERTDGLANEPTNEIKKKKDARKGRKNDGTKNRTKERKNERTKERKNERTAYLTHFNW